jgi:GT2 family glycosyltransferase
MKLSVVLATFNRLPLLKRLLEQLGRQTLDPSTFEVVVVDDGSKEPVEPHLETLKTPYRLKVETQANAGAAAARHRGVLAASGEVLVITDDDMQVAPEFLAEHLAMHPEGTRRAVMGHIRADPRIGDMPFFERWYAYRLDSLAQGMKRGTTRLRGNFLYTGNLSLRRADYLAVGGFDPDLKRSEDAELGLRLEASGVELCFSHGAYTLHGSDHTSKEVWLKRAYLYGIYDSKIFQKHPHMAHASPWRFMLRISPVARPLLGAAAVAPKLTRPLSEAALAAVQVADKVGLEKLAFAGSAVVYSMEYFRGVRDEAGGLTTAVKDFAKYLGAVRGRVVEDG